MAEKDTGFGCRVFLFRLSHWNELDQAAFGVEGLFLGRRLALVLERDPDAPVEERQLPEPVGEGAVAELEDGEDLIVGLEPDRRAGALGLADSLELLLGLAPHERHVMATAVAVHPDLELLGEGVDHRDADAVESARDLVARLVELAAGVEHRQRHCR
jgi:hypothetical protein